MINVKSQFSVDISVLVSVFVFSFSFDLYEAKLYNTEAVIIIYVQEKLTHTLIKRLILDE